MVERALTRGPGTLSPCVAGDTCQCPGTSASSSESSRHLSTDSQGSCHFQGTACDVKPGGVSSWKLGGFLPRMHFLLGGMPGCE